MANTDDLTATTSTKAPGPGLWFSLIVLTVGFSACCLGAYLAFQSAFELLSVDSFETPGEQTRSLDPGEYEIYVRSASVSILDFDLEFDDFLRDAGQITVTDDSTGQQVSTETFVSSETLGRSANVYEGVARFEVENEGRYTVRVDTRGPSRAVFGRSIESALDRVTPWLILAGVGLLLFILGTILLIVGLVRRKKHRDTPATLQVPPVVPQPVSPTGSVSMPAPAQPPPPQPTETETPWGD